MNSIKERRRIYITWNNMKKRCYSDKSDKYKNYGGRGIIVCEQWLIFDNFYLWALDSGYKNDLTIERINVNGNYCPENCTWIEKSKQASNKQNTVIINALGEEKTISEWVNDPRCKVTKSGIQHRLKSNWNPDDIILTPPQQIQSIKAFNEIKTATEWTQDIRCRVNRKILKERIRIGWNPEFAITTSQILVEQKTLITWLGETKTIGDWINDSRCTISRANIRTRIRLGWEDKEIMEIPVTRGQKREFLKC